MAHEPIYRQYHHHQMTFSMVYAYSENYVLPISHDEVVHGKGSLLRKMPGDRWQQLANLRAYLAFMWAHPGKQLLFMGSEFGQESEWAESRSLDWWLLDNPDHRGVQTLVARPQPGLRREPRAVVARLRPGRLRAGSTPTTRATTCSRSCATATTARRWPASRTSPAIPHEGYRLGLPHAGRWDEVLNTDAEAYVGSGVGNLGGVEAGADGWHGQPASATLRVPPLGTVWLRHHAELTARVVRLVYETHATTIDNEAGVATGWLPGELSADRCRERPRPRPAPPRRRHRPRRELGPAPRRADGRHRVRGLPRAACAPTPGCASATTAT